MNIYLAARYSRRLELCGYREQLRALGHKVDAVWLNGTHQVDDKGQPIGDRGESLVEGEAAHVIGDSLRIKFAKDDFSDVRHCDALVAFTELPRANCSSRGGRHVELGIALGMHKIVHVVGPRENIFCYLPQIYHHETWEDCLQFLKQVEPE